MNKNFTTLLIIISFFSCKKERQNLFVGNDPIAIEAEVLDYSDEINHIKAITKKGNYNKNIAFMIDYSIHSGKNRFFVVDLKKDSIIKKELVCHGDGKGKNTTGIPTVFSNRSETHCSSLGMAVMGERAYSSWGKNYKYWIDGLEETNSNMRKRIVVLHGWKGMPNKETYPNPIATSWGCPTVSVDVLDELDVLLKENKKVLLYSFE
ncbi:peptidase [Aureibaculum algae]|uniref:Peptidase n=1 Tax=Aureibaculum algae TaxID=2584122 RepID=A0A5B7TNR5_9FLAO|nr:murein L,D-transpeptidase catalytic domain family protein [Aureibaculum algae]QCX37031.1 peptidase [Aureibaculum algae]